jgi:hypothetical protein
MRTLTSGFVVMLISSASIGAQAQRATRPSSAPDTLIAIVGATLIDGTGGAAVSDATVVVRGKRIAAVGPRAAVHVPAGAHVVDGTGKFATPGFIDTNVHLSLYNNGESMVRYEDRFLDLVVEAAQTELKYGITTSATATVRSFRSSSSAIRSPRASCSDRACSSPATSSGGVDQSRRSSRTPRRRPSSMNA